MNHDGQSHSNPHHKHEIIDEQLISDIICPFSEQLIKETQVDSIPLADKELNQQVQFDKQLLIRALEQQEPNLQNILLYANKQLVFNHYDNHPQFDRQFPFHTLNKKQPQLTNTCIRPHPKLQDSQLGKQQEYDKQALVADIDRNQADIISIKRRQDQQIEVARQKAIDNDLKIGKQQENIKIKSVEDVYVDSRVYQNQGVLPLENVHDFEQENTVAEFEIPIINKKRIKENQIKNSHNTIHKSTKIKSQEIEYDEDWQTNIHATSFPKRGQKANSNIDEQIERQVNSKKQAYIISERRNEHKSKNGQNHNIVRYIKSNPLVQYAKGIHLNKKLNNLIIH